MSASTLHFPSTPSEAWTSQTFTSSGTFNVPAGVDKVFVEMYGGGGGGAGGGTGQGWGGEAGDRVQALIGVTPGGSVSVTLGAGGAGGAFESNGSNGGDTTFGAFRAAGGYGGTRWVYADTVSPPAGGRGMGKSGYRAIGGAPSGINFGGDGAYGAGGAGGSAGNGGYGAGGGSQSSSGSGGNGGAGICIVFWESQTKVAID